MIRWWKRLICKIKGHRYEAHTLMPNALIFCKRCGSEILGRTFADLEPMTEEEREMLFGDDDWWR